MHRKPMHSARDERGQILVIFALSATALIAMVGLVLDGSGAFAQRRVEQNVADIAALAGANAYMNTDDTVTARTLAAYAAADASATRNGYTHGQDGVVVTPNVVLGSSGAFVTVDITEPHENGFARVVGQNSWDVSVTATAEAGSIDTAVGAAPWIMHVDAFNDGEPIYDEDNPYTFGETNGDYPVSATDIAWTDFNGSDNVNTDEVSDIIYGQNVVSARMSEDQYIGQHNNGEHAALYGQVDTVLAGQTLPVPIVGDCPDADPSPGGCFKGWAFFYVVTAAGGTDKTITGYFIDDFKRKPLSVGVCTPDLEAAGECGIITQSPFADNLVVRLVD